ncbi:putative ATP-dependent RNA helicase ucp12 [Cryptotrichosporon argae]
MAPKRRPVNVVRSGNAGNSSKPSKPKDDGATAASAAEPARPPPLFPVGYKSPVAMLNEKCQKMGWERPAVEARQNRGADTWTGLVVLKKRTSKNVYDLDQVRLAPSPPLEIESAAMAKHYAATYALFRFCSHLPLALTLPPVIRPYWSTLLAEKASAPTHRAWEWDSDPFAARKEVDERQRRREVKKATDAAEGAGGSGGGGDSGRATPARDGSGHAHGHMGKAWENAPEVRMAPALRETVENTVRKMMRRFPAAVLDAARETGPPTPASGAGTPALDLDAVRAQLGTLAFRPAHIASCLSAVQAAHARLHAGSSAAGPRRDPLVLALSTLSPLEASIEWLLLHVPEDDLPPRYRPSASSADFVTGASRGQAAIVRGWLTDKLVKRAGFPRKAVEAVLEAQERESAALDRLGRQLCGWTDDWAADAYVAFAGDASQQAARDEAREEEVLALEAVLGERFTRELASELAIGIDAALTLRVVFDDASPYPSAAQPVPPAFYLSSDSLPSYMRLHLHRALLDAFRDPTRHDLASVLEAGSGGAVLSMVEFLETALPDVVANPPDVGDVTQHLVPRVDEVEDEVQARAERKARPRVERKRKEPTAAEHEEVRKRNDELHARKEYKAMLEERSRLPAWKERDNICHALDNSRVLVVVGELPQFLLDHEIAAGRGAATSIIVTQPRRVAAMGVASRVANERLEDVDRPGTVGYAIRGERRASRDTRLLFCTTGVVLRRLGGDKDLDGVSHVIVDEAHERGVDTDLLICLLRDILERNKKIKASPAICHRWYIRAHLQVVLMSATINESIFIKYFGGCPSLTIPGFTHPVTDQYVYAARAKHGAEGSYLEDILPLLNYQPQPSRFGPRMTEDQKAAMRADFAKLALDPPTLRALEILSQSDRIDYGLIAAVVAHITAASASGAILIFLPGVMEIRQCIAELESTVCGPVAILPLHANLSSAEQKRVFDKTARRKVVVATNVAETSVTIPDVVYVVDAGRVKETAYDAESGMQRLVEQWTSRASGRQRRGRAGRTQPGQCYKLYTRRTENNSMPRFPVPEMLRTPLESLFLQVKAMDEDTDVKAFLTKALDPPKLDAIDAAWRTLLDLGAVESEDHASRLTALGRHMSMIPVDLRLSKMLVLGTIFKCLDPVLTIAALLSSKPLFTSPLDRRDEAKRAREAFATARSDLLTDVKAYNSVVALRDKGAGQSAVRQHCEANFISPSTVRDVTSLRADFLAALSAIGFVGQARDDLAAASANAHSDNLVKAVLVGGLYPRVARIQLPEAQYERVQQGAVQKDHEAKQVKFFDRAGRVFLHPSSVLFAESGFRPGYVAYFQKAETSKVFLRDATEVPLYGLLLFGGAITINHWAGGLVLGAEGDVRLRAATRVGVLCAQLRRLLDAQLAEQIEAPTGVGAVDGGEVVQAMMALLHRDGLSA